MILLFPLIQVREDLELQDVAVYERFHVGLDELLLVLLLIGVYFVVGRLLAVLVFSLFALALLSSRIRESDYNSACTTRKPFAASSTGFGPF